MKRALTVFAVLLTACGGSPQASSQESFDPNAVAAVLADPGPVAATVPAGNALPPVRSWELHSSSAGFAVFGRNASGASEVNFVVPTSTTESQFQTTEAQMVPAPGFNYAAEDVLTALATDLGASDAQATGMASEGIHPQDIDLVKVCAGVKQAVVDTVKCLRDPTDPENAAKIMNGILFVASAADCAIICHELTK